jgi:trans-2,3-dihydro-3-hydroxyanthranilate isomerase
MTIDSSLQAPRIYLVRVFCSPDQRNGGNPAPIVLQADGMTHEDMRRIAARSGHESGFVFRPQDTDCQFQMRYFVPNHEMEMCGHATVGALWLLRQKQLWDGQPINIQTLSGKVKARELDGTIEISQPAAIMVELDATQVIHIADALNVPLEIIRTPVINASTSRVKTLVRMSSLDALRRLQPRLNAIQSVCESIGSTGLYPFAEVDVEHRVFEARQFPKSSGYPEDAATGIAATALSFGLRKIGLVSQQASRLCIRQGFSMGSPSEIHVQLPDANLPLAECWLSGRVCLENEFTLNEAADDKC